MSWSGLIPPGGRGARCRRRSVRQQCRRAAEWGVTDSSRAAAGHFFRTYMVPGLILGVIVGRIRR